MLENKARDIIVSHARATLTKIPVESGACRYNFRCHNNAVNDALNNNQDSIAMCIYIDEGYPVIHFINIDNDGIYTDNTLGRWSETVEYFLVKKIPKVDFFTVSTVFSAYRKELKRKIPFVIRILNWYKF